MLRRLSTGRLALLLATLVAAAAGAGVALAAGAATGTPPPAEPLPNAIHDALTAPAPSGVSGRLSFTNDLIPSGTLGRGGSSPLLSGASGRFWATADGHVRLELQSADGSGDVQILYDGSTVQVYDASSNTVYRAELPSRSADQGGTHGPPTVAQIEKELGTLAGALTISGPTPTTVAGQGAYLVRVSPKANGGLLGAAELAWDAAHGTPLRLAVYAPGSSAPVLELTATQIAFGPVPSSDVALSPPAGAHVVDLGTIGGASSGNGSAQPAPVTGVAAVSAHVPFGLVAPGSLAGRQLAGARLVHLDGTPAALLAYGKGLDGIAVLEAQPRSGSGGGPSGATQATLPTVQLANGVTGQELPTALGTIVRFARGGVSFAVAASQPSATVVAAARTLAG